MLKHHFPSTSRATRVHWCSTSSSAYINSPVKKKMRVEIGVQVRLPNLEEFVREYGPAEDDQSFILPQFAPSPPDNLLREFVEKYGGVEETEDLDASIPQETQ